ncbi:hypothetical protein MNB_ARC-1_816 [hydrothermal vent metagenome]|uniref:ADP-heptose:LPS heptosyltransferase n=1 Tax=hydrothermal vent metagenome TaxID=652676 RepID=A0A3B1E625_9ZZZZ
MVFFTTKKDFSISQDFNQINLNFQSVQNDINTNNIYLSSILEIEKIGEMQKDILSIIDENKISHFITSKELGASYKGQLNQIVSNSDKMFESSFVDLDTQIKNTNKKSISIAFIGCFGGGIGDLISSIPALRIFVDILKNKFEDINIDIYAHQFISSIYKNTKFFFEKEDYIRDIFTLPISIDKLNKYDFYVDTIFFMQDRKSLCMPIVDLSLYKLGIDCEKIENKLLNISLQEDIFSLVKKYVQQKAQDKMVILFHPKSSTALRSIPDEISCLMLNTLLGDENIFVISVNDINFFKHDRFLDASALSLSLEHFFSFIGSVDFCISSDTSVYHIAGNLNIPSVVFFTSIEPHLRIKYYKNIYPIYLENKDIKNIHNEVRISKDINLGNIFDNFDIVEFTDIINKVKKQIKHKQ